MAHKTEIGKNILDMFMFSLYPEAETIYREYLQNACDSINEAISRGVLQSQDDGHIDIKIDKYKSTITITDNGIGIESKYAESRLKDIAKSTKRNSEAQAGFYGIGRLVGAGYCKKLTFQTSYAGEDETSELTFDVEQISAILNDDTNDMGATEVIDATTVFKTYPKVLSEKSFFRVILSDIKPEYPELLDGDEILKYLVQVAPLPYSPVFKNNYLKPALSSDEYSGLYESLSMIQVSLNDNVDIRKKYSTIVEGTNDEIIQLRPFILKNSEFGDLAWGWYAITAFDKQIPDNDATTGKEVLTRGMRLRIHNIQIGTQNFFDGTTYFKQARSNKYFNGEIHVINPKIKPTTDRADLAPSAEALVLKAEIRKFFNNEMQQVYQTANKAKNELKRFKEAECDKLLIECSPIPEENTPVEIEQKITEAELNKKKAESELEKLQNKENLSKGEEIMLSIYQKRKEDFVNTQKEEKIIQVQQEKKAEKPVTKKKNTIEEDIDSLEKQYGVEKIAMLKRIFQIMDTRYSGKTTSLITSIKSSIIKDLKK